MKKEITQERLRELFNLDPETGSLYWKRNIIGGVAGCLRTDGYWNIFIDGKFYQRGRVVFLFCTGFLPKEVDHRNRIPSDDRPSNLKAK